MGEELCLSRLQSCRLKYINANQLPTEYRRKVSFTGGAALAVIPRLGHHLDSVAGFCVGFLRPFVQATDGGVPECAPLGLGVFHPDD